MIYSIKPHSLSVIDDDDDDDNSSVSRHPLQLFYFLLYVCVCGSRNLAFIIFHYWLSYINRVNKNKYQTNSNKKIKIQHSSLFLCLLQILQLHIKIT